MRSPDQSGLQWHRGGAAPLGHVPRPGAGYCPAALPTPSHIQPLFSHLSFLPGSTSLLPNLRPGPHFLQATGCPQSLETSIMRNCCLFDRKTQVGAESRGWKCSLTSGCPHYSRSGCWLVPREKAGRRNAPIPQGQIPVPLPAPGPHVQSLVGISLPLLHP